MDKKKWILPYLKQYNGSFMLVVFLGTLTILFSGGLMFTSGYLISKSSTRPESILMVYVPIVGVRTFGNGRAVLSYVERLTGHQFILKILSELRVRLYKIIEPQALFLRSRYGTGDILGILADDIEHLQDFYLKILFPSIVSLMIYAMILIGTGIFSLWFSFLMAIIAGLLIIVGPILSYIYMKKKNEQFKQGRLRLYQQFTDAVFGISDWLFSGRYMDFVKRYETQQFELQEIERRKKAFINWRDLFNQTVLGLAVIISIYWATGMTLKGEIPGTFIAAFALVTMSLLESFFPISEAVSEGASYQESINRLENLQSEEGPRPALDEKEDIIDYSSVTIELKQLSFQYSSELLLLNDISIKIKPGEKIAILGPSGAGKSTLLKLIQGALLPISGEVLINGKNADKLFIPNIMSVLNQKAYLFHTSILNNIRLGSPERADEDVYDAARQVQLQEMIEQLPNGYDTNMHETGQRFSGGERQRIALARTLIKQTPVIIMDEPTIGLDPITENNLLETIFDTLKEKTIIWVTHHLAGMEKMDRILFIDEGKITMAGSHQQLLETEERYQRLYQMDYPVKPGERFF
ncbi:thiol reductant ABC exporter subunit CydC [Neobacillus vireti]|uniref:thiol reductant ABC exporter subunit CydC n=1 Tax=Neobacillus vireti TaxID=220686 RepID=UPI002FFDF641